MAEASDYLEDELLDHVFGNATYTSPASVWVKLFLADPTDDGTGTAALETTRKQATFGTASGGSITTTADIEWTNVSTTETYSHIGIYDASSGGNLLCHTALDASRAITAGENFTIPSGSLTVTLA